jgi:hypothetical protein
VKLAHITAKPRNSGPVNSAISPPGRGGKNVLVACVDASCAVKTCTMYVPEFCKTRTDPAPMQPEHKMLMTSASPTQAPQPNQKSPAGKMTGNNITGGIRASESFFWPLIRALASYLK